jgi:hypothetical protein
VGREFNIGMTDLERLVHRPGRGIDPTKPYLNVGPNGRTLADVWRLPVATVTPFAGKEPDEVYILVWRDPNGRRNPFFLNKSTSNTTLVRRNCWEGSKVEGEVLLAQWPQLSLERVR